jgi:hypothetical protein
MKIILISIGTRGDMELFLSIGEILERNKIPAIINIASGGSVEPEKYAEGRIHFVPQIPYDWLFSENVWRNPSWRIRDDSSGTGVWMCKHDQPAYHRQFVWNKTVYHLGAGPKGI